MRRVKVMGVVNVTPDSFSDGGKFFRPEEAVRRAVNLIEEGADIIDLGGESTRPGATPIGWEEEWSRIEPVLKTLNPQLSTLNLSIDTYHPETAERALAAGATMINCVKMEAAEAMLALAEEYAGHTANGVGLVLPAKILDEPGFSPSAFHVSLYFDPMIGFGTTREEDVELLRSIPELAKRGPILVGASRKRIVKKLTGEKTTGKNLAGNLAIAMWAAMHGASAVRVHDVKETVEALKVLEALG